MAQLSIAGDASGSITLAAPAVSGTTTLTLPTTTGTILTDTTVTGTAKAWAYYSLTGAAVTINKSYNVSSITYVSTGLATVNFTNALLDANYVALGSSSWDTSQVSAGVTGTPYNGTKTTTSCQMWSGNGSASAINATRISVAFFD